MKFNEAWLAWAGTEIAAITPPTLRCKDCGHEWMVTVGPADQILPDGAWFCPRCKQDPMHKVREQDGKAS